MVPRPGSMSEGDKLEDLQRRHQLLVSEKRSNEESGSNQMNANKEALRRLSETNNKLRAEITSASQRGKSLAPSDDSNIEEVIKLKNRFNALRADNMRKEHVVSQLKTQLETFSASKIEDPSGTDRRIRVLENRIDKAMIKYNEAQSIKKTYEGILHRLKEERIGFDHQLEDLEKQLEAKKKDYEELLLLSHDALHAKEMAQAELHRFEQAVMEERNQRDREVMEKKLLVQQRIEMNQRLERRDKEAVPVIAVVGNKDEPCSNRVTVEQGPVDEAQKTQQRLNEYEEAYSKLKEVTGVSDVNEIIQKFIAQEVTHTNLVKLTQDQQSTLDSLNLDLEKLKIQLDEIKFSGASVALTNGPISSDNSVDESLVAESFAKLEKNRSRYETLAKILIDVNAGVGHLYDKLACVALDGRKASDNLVLSDETIEEVLSICELKISKLLETTRESPSSPTPEFKPDIRVRGPGDGRTPLDDVDFESGGAGNANQNDAFNRKLFKANSNLFVEKIKKAFHSNQRPLSATAYKSIADFCESEARMKDNIDCYWLDESIIPDDPEIVALGLGIVCVVKEGAPFVQRVGFTPVHLNVRDIVSATCGLDHVVLRDSCNTLYFYGDDSQGQCGGNAFSAAKIESTITRVTGRMACSGATCTLIVHEDNTLETFGSNDEYQLGFSDSTTNDKFFPWLPASIQLISSGYAHSCLVAGGVLYGSGLNSHGQLSFLTEELQQVGFKAWTDALTIRSVACGYWTTALITADGKLYVVGKVPAFQDGPRSLPQILDGWTARSSRKFAQVGEWKNLPLPEPAAEVKIGSSLSLVLSMTRRTLFLIDLFEHAVVRVINSKSAIRSFTVAGRNWAYT